LIAIQTCIILSYIFFLFCFNSKWFTVFQINIRIVLILKLVIILTFQLLIWSFKVLVWKRCLLLKWGSRSNFFKYPFINVVFQYLNSNVNIIGIIHSRTLWNIRTVYCLLIFFVLCASFAIRTALFYNIWIIFWQNITDLVFHILWLKIFRLHTFILLISKIIDIWISFPFCLILIIPFFWRLK